MSECEKHEFENTLALHTAPTLLGVKCANLVSVSQSERTVRSYVESCAESAAAHGVRMKILCRCRERTLVYVYHEKLLSAWLSRADVGNFLSDHGYTADMSFEEKLSLLTARMSCGSFPHEIGAFLGYPIEDIRGFIENQGRNCLLCGCWKVYGNVEAARRTFNIYGRCRDILCDRLNKGLDIFQALKISKEELS